ncbi:type II toxin-antitoxin system VapC family toxin [Halegenticoccus soli]|uniref:type II toxin-antitoxin system VapC family toxin n=1 Tax=Halegenticoccus soli TaxID=1985678 RepID=UPI000C6D1001|nr:PIN domain-containing protein [Halegenticoccus soli]
MRRALVDTTVLFAAVYPRDAHHESALPILKGVDGGDLPEAIVLDYVLAETLNGLVRKASHDSAVDFLRRIEENSRFHPGRLTAESFARAKSVFRAYPGLSFVDAALVAHAQDEGIAYLYAFDDDFDAVDDLYRLDTATDPYRA